jgi:MFS family permease
MVVFIIGTGIRLSFGVLIDPLVENYGWSRGGISLAYTFSFLAGIPAVLVVGRLAEKHNSRRLVTIGAIIFTVGMLLTATATKLWQFQLYFGVLIGGLGAAPFTVLLPVLLSRWFYRKLGLAIGLMWTSLSLGPAILSPLMRWYIESADWSQTFIVFGLTGGALTLISGFFLKDNPQEMGLNPYGGLPPEPPEQTINSPDTGINLYQVIRAGSFWKLTAVHLLGCIGHSVLLAHMVSMATFAGIPSVAAAGVLSIAVATSVISRFGMSLVADTKGARFTLSFAVLLQTLPPLLLLGARKLWSFYSFAFLFGLGYGGEMVGFPIFNRQYYGVKAPLDTIYAYQMAGAQLGMAIGGWLGGALFDWTGVYTWSILLSVGASFLGVVVAVILPSYKR